MTRYADALEERIREIVREELTDAGLVQHGMINEASPTVAHVTSEPCVRCGFTFSAHIDGYCPDNYASNKSKFQHKPI